jgi:hypothetical protein
MAQLIEPRGKRLFEAVRMTTVNTTHDKGSVWGLPKIKVKKEPGYVVCCLDCPRRVGSAWSMHSVLSLVRREVEN